MVIPLRTGRVCLLLGGDDAGGVRGVAHFTLYYGNLSVIGGGLRLEISCVENLAGSMEVCRMKTWLQVFRLL